MFDSGPSGVEFSRPLGDCQTFAVPFNPVRLSAVAVLLKRVRPLTIGSAITARVVDAVQRIAGWADAHLCVKGRKGVPWLINEQAFSAVACEQSRIRVMAALHHLRPNAIFPTFVEPVLPAGGSDCFFPLAPTGFHAFLQVAASIRAKCSALASARPPFHFVTLVPSRLGGLFQHCQPSEDAAGQVNHWSAHIAHLTTCAGE